MLLPSLARFTHAVNSLQLLCLFASVGRLNSELNLPIKGIEQWAVNFGNAVFKMSESATALQELQMDYLLMDTKVEPIRGSKLLRNMKQRIEGMLSKKAAAVKTLVKVAEEAYASHIPEKYVDHEGYKILASNFSEDSEDFVTTYKIDYPKAKKLNKSEFPLEENAHFGSIPVNLFRSTVHVPTNVYDESDEVLNGVDWSEKLDEFFRKNYEDDPTLTWQYFGSASGFLRSYPGMEWPMHGVDVFDCRTCGWYIQAANSPKDLILLIDTSGSMTGQRLEIAKATVEKILQTLSDDDYFNVIKFSDTSEYVDHCFNGTLVQANADNKKRIMASLDNIITRNMAKFEGALTEAFEVLNAMNETGQCSQCNRAIMLITDGAPETHEDIFKTYNWPEKNIRMFTFVIGREVGESKAAQWMACANKGYYSHISTLADVHEHVQDYIHVLSRPMVIERVDHTIWTNVYVDKAVSVQDVPQLVMSVAQPVFDIRNTTLYKGILLGIVGTDVPLSQLTKLAPQYKVGVNGYVFAITNNGYVIFHPDFRPMQDDKMKPNYNSVDLAEVELADNIDALRKLMVDRATKGPITMKVKIHYDDMKRVAIREQNYFVTDIADTPFSLGIALPAGYGMNRLKGLLKVQDADLDALRASQVKIAPWNYCELSANESKHDPLEAILVYLKYGQQKKSIYKEKCDDQLIQGLLYDAKATRGALANWMKVNADGTLNDSMSRRKGIEVVFLGTKSGLTRYYTLVENVTDRNFVYNVNGTIEELYYKQAVENGEGIFTFSVPFNAGAHDWWNETVLTASTPIIVSEDGREAVAAVVGLQMSYPHFYEMFINMSKTCDDPTTRDCNLTCESAELDCYLLDNNGFVVLSENQGEIGKFFGELDATLMKALIIDDDDGTSTPGRGVFERVEVVDYQALCAIWKRGSSAASSLVYDPLRWIFGTIFSAVHEIAIFLIQYSVYSLWSGGPTTVNAADGDAEKSEDFHSAYLNRLMEFSSEDQVQQWGQELVKGPIDYTNRQEVREWYEDKVRKFGPHLVRLEACVKRTDLYRLRTGALPESGTLTKCGWCKRSYTVHRVPRTNLMLLAVDSQCYCIVDEPVTVEPREVTHIDTLLCEKLKKEAYRKRPAECYAYHPKEDSSDCGAAGSLEASLFTTIVFLAWHAVVV
ncbi:hypothetical protein NP493_248g03021 [Ridgeia piscesae]|uniref:VWFA domain-containing protein n=1 Tax=Ridgeia piscesae TaxID=27915 RepID=A0AAD9NYV8_RIDPI|nr:hypothetical protein NP493_248g03021 [Ridgeia piscesae]